MIPITYQSRTSSPSWWGGPFRACDCACFVPLLCNPGNALAKPMFQHDISWSHRPNLRFHQIFLSPDPLRRSRYPQIASNRRARPIPVAPAPQRKSSTMPRPQLSAADLSNALWSLPPGGPLSARANARLEVPPTVICHGDIDLIPVVTLVITYARAIHALTTKDLTLTLDYRGAVVSVSRNSSLSRSNSASRPCCARYPASSAQSDFSATMTDGPMARTHPWARPTHAPP
jgi:hypothetical protein